MLISISKSVLRYSFFFVLVTILLLSGSTVHCQENNIRINEFMALNQTILVDKDGGFEDWFEIYNPTAAAVDLADWSITDSGEEPRKWVFPQVTIQAGAYLVIFASGKDIRTGDELHTNFKLSGDGEYFALIDPSATVVTEFNPFPVQYADISYSYFDGDFDFSIDPTPNAANIFSAHELLPPPVFSINHGYFETPQNVTITTELQDAQIYYTTDGSEPSQTNGTLYTDPVQVTTTTVLRAITVKTNELKSKPNTRTYLFLDDVINQPNNPPDYPSEWGPYTAISGNAIADYEMDTEITQSPEYSGVMVDALKSLPVLSIVTDKDNLFSSVEDPETGGIYYYTGPPLSNTENGVGFGWERPASVELFNADGTEDLQVNCGIKLHGGHSRRPEKSPKHSFRLVFKGEYGPSTLDYPLYDDVDAATLFNVLVLRAGFNNVWNHHDHTQRARSQYVTDSWAKKTQREMGHPAGRGRFVHLYLNGLYWGVYDLAERINSDFAAFYMGGDEIDYDVMKDYAEAADGTADIWNQMMDLANAGLSSTEAYQRIQGNNPDGTPNPTYENFVDVVSLIDYMLLNFYGGNTDWDHHNWVAARSRTFPGKGFKFFSWDGEHLLESTNHNMLDENNADCPSRLFQALRQNSEFRQVFADRVQLHFFNEGVLTSEAASARWQKYTQELDLAIVAESARWGDYRRDVHQYQTSGPFELYNKNEHWNAEQNYLLNDYFPNRTNIFINQLRQANLFPDVAAPVFEINDEIVSQPIINVGDELTMTAAQGTIYYTDNGDDPRISDTSVQGEQDFLISQNANKRVFIPGSDIGTSWRTDVDFNDSAWQLCSGAPGGIGYEQNSGYQDWITLDVTSGMYNINTSCYVRIPFNLTAQDLDKYKSLSLSILYDDGFVAYLNGTKVAEVNAPATPAWNSQSSSGHEAELFQLINLSDYIDNLVAGDNLLAIHGLNLSLTSSDFIIIPELLASEESGAGGDVSASAVTYADPITLNETTQIKARALDNGEWSALTEMVFVVPEQTNDLKVTEFHYHPLDEGDISDNVFEFIELKNIGTTIIDLSNAYFAQGITFNFPAGSVIRPNEFIVLASHRDYFYSRYGLAPFGEFIGFLDNGGERVTLVNVSSDTLFSIRYNDRAPWPITPDGHGYSLVPNDTNPAGDQNDASNWRQSYEIHGSPGRDDTETSSTKAETDTKPMAFQLYQNYPNPFNPVTKISYSILKSGFVTLKIYDILGKEVKVLVNGHQKTNTYSVSFNAIGLSTGVYFYRLQVGNEYVKTRKMILMR